MREKNVHSAEKAFMPKAAKLKARYVPFRFIFVVLLIVTGTFASVAGVAALCYFFRILCLPVTVIYVLCVLRIIRSDDNPDYKAPWLILIFILPLGGLVIYLTFYSRRLPKRQQKLFNAARAARTLRDDGAQLKELKDEDMRAYGQVRQLRAQAGAHVYKNTRLTYFPLGEDMYVSLVEDLKRAKKFIFLEYFTIERGIFWNRILDILKEKVQEGVEVCVVYDDIGSMCTLPGNYFKRLRKLGIKSVPFSRFRATSDGEFNNRNHRKITVIDGAVAYTGGANIADEYINVKQKFGHWKDCGIRLEGEAVAEFTLMFMVDYLMNVKKPDGGNAEKYFPEPKICASESYVVPFGDGPVPVYRENVAKNIFTAILNQATDYVYMTTPYLIIDNELCRAMENAASRGVDVRIITPHIPDKKIIFFMTRSYYARLVKSGVKIYEYTPGFIHAKIMVSDDTTGIVGTVNLDYRSLVHHFEDGVWFYKDPVVAEMKSDFLNTVNVSSQVKPEHLKSGFLRRFFEAVIKLFAPLL